jgi:hypothetical protein
MFPINCVHTHMLDLVSGNNNDKPKLSRSSREVFVLLGPSWGSVKGKCFDCDLSLMLMSPGFKFCKVVSHMRVCAAAMLL